MILPKPILEQGISLKDQYFDLRGLSAYSAIKVPTLRDHIRRDGLPCFKVRGKVIIRRSEFDRWIEGFRVDSKQRLDDIVEDVMRGLKWG